MLQPCLHLPDNASIYGQVTIHGSEHKSASHAFWLPKADHLTWLHLHEQIKPGMRMAVEPHGGHFWSTQGQVQRPMDVVSLRIDNAERMANQLNDAEISPTNYMTAFLRQRGWKLPDESITIPNVIPEVEPDAAAVCHEIHAACLVCLLVVHKPDSR